MNYVEFWHQVFGMSLWTPLIQMFRSSPPPTTVGGADHSLHTDLRPTWLARKGRVGRPSSLSVCTVGQGHQTGRVPGTAEGVRQPDVPRDDAEGCVPVRQSDCGFSLACAEELLKRAQAANPFAGLLGHPSPACTTALCQCRHPNVQLITNFQSSDAGHWRIF